MEKFPDISKLLGNVPDIDSNEGRTKENNNIISMIENFILAIIPICWNQILGAWEINLWCDNVSHWSPSILCQISLRLEFYTESAIKCSCRCFKLLNYAFNKEINV